MKTNNRVQRYLSSGFELSEAVSIRPKCLVHVRSTLIAATGGMITEKTRFLTKNGQQFQRTIFFCRNADGQIHIVMDTRFTEHLSSELLCTLQQLTFINYYPLQVLPLFFLMFLMLTSWEKTLPFAFLTTLCFGYILFCSKWKLYMISIRHNIYLFMQEPILTYY